MTIPRTDRPQMDCGPLRRAIAEHHEVDPAWVFVGPGSIEVVAAVMDAAKLTAPGSDPWETGALVRPHPGLDALDALARARRIPHHHTRLRPDGSVDIGEVATAMAVAPRALAVIASPHSPTGTVLTRSEVEYLLTRARPDDLLVLDHTYKQFETTSGAVNGVTDLVERWPNLFVTYTFSEAHGLPEIGVGYGIGQRAAELAQHAVSEASQAAAMIALEDAHGRLDINVLEVIGERTRLANALSHYLDPEKKGLVQVGHGNFVWVRGSFPEDHFAGTPVQVQVFPGHGVRISVGRPADTTALLKAWFD